MPVLSLHIIWNDMLFVFQLYLKEHLRIKSSISRLSIGDIQWFGVEYGIYFASERVDMKKNPTKTFCYPASSGNGNMYNFVRMCAGLRVWDEQIPSFICTLLLHVLFI